MANTLNLGTDGNWALKENSLLAYNSENDNFKPLPFDFTRASNATRVNKLGLIETVSTGQPRIDFLGNTNGSLLLEPQRTNLITQSEAFANNYWTKSGASIEGDASTAGSELVTNGDFSTDSDWIKGSGWTISGGKGVATSVGSGQRLQQNFSFTNSKSYKIVVVLSNYTSGRLGIYMGGAYIDMSIVEEGTYIYYHTPTSGSEFFFRVMDSGTTLSIDNISVKEVQGFASPSADSPLGAFKLVEGTSFGDNNIYPTAEIPITNTTTYSSHHYVKKGENNIVGFQDVINSQYWATVNLNTGTILDEKTSGSTKVLSLGNDFYKISFTFTSNTTSAKPAIFLLPNSYTSGRPSDQDYTGDGTSGVYIFGASLELGSYPTSYIKTEGSTVTRVADICSQTPPDGIIGQTEGTVFLNLSWTEIASNIYYVFSDGTASNRILIYSTSESEIFILIQSGGITSASFSISGQNTRILNKIAVSYKNNDFKVALNGIIKGTDTSGNAPQSVDFIDFLLYGKIAENKLYNTALSEAELIALTQV